MTKKILAALLAVCMLLSLAACSSSNDTKDVAGKTSGNESTAEDTTANDKKAVKDVDYVKEKGKLVIGITEFEPINYKDKKTGEWTGFDTEFAQAFAKKLGVEAEFIVITWSRKYNELDSKSIDAVWNGMTITDEVKMNTSVSNPYARNAQVVVMAKDKLDSYKDADSLKDLKFAVEEGGAGEELAKEITDAKNITAFEAQSDALLEVKSGSSDACVVDKITADAMTGEGTNFADLGYSIELNKEEYGVGFRKGSDLVNAFNDFMAEMKADGSLQKLADKYNITLA